MTDPDQTPLSASEQEVRRLLASARHTEPLPPEVSARLDGVLAGLAAGEHDVRATRSPSVTDLDAHRRRRRVAQLLVAAAAVVVVGVGLNQVIDRAGDGSSSDSSTAADAPAAQEDAAGAGAGARPQRSDGDFVTAPKSLAEIRPRAFDLDVRQLQRAYDTSADNLLTDQRGQAGALAAGVACRTRAWGSGTFVPVSYGGSPAVLVLRRPQGDTQVADLYLCGQTVPVRSVTLPAP